MKVIRIFVALSFVVLITDLTVGETEAQKKDSRSYIDRVTTIKKTANQKGYEDLVTNELLRKYLVFAPHAPGHLMDLGCAWGYTIQQILALEARKPFLAPSQRKIFAVDMSQQHLDHVAATTPRTIVETCLMEFPNQKSSEINNVFSPNTIGAIYSGLMLHYLSGNELVQGLKLLYKATAPGGRIYISVKTPFVSPALEKDFLHRKNNLKEEFPGWYPNVYDREEFRGKIPDFVRKQQTAFLHVFDHETMSKYLEKAGFRVLDHFYFLRNTMMRMKLLGIVAEKKAK